MVGFGIKWRGVKPEMKRNWKSLSVSALSVMALASVAIAIPHKTLANTQAATTKQVALFATTPQARTGQGVTLTAATNTPLSSGQSLAIMDVTTGEILNRITSGTSVSTVIIHHSPQTDNFAAVLTNDSTPLAVSWVARAVGNNAGYENAAGQSVSLVSPTTAIPGFNFTVTAEPTGFKAPVYQFWWAMQGGQWHSSGSFSSANSFTINAPRTGFLSVLVYAREASAPQNENADQQAIYESKSDTAVVSVGDAASVSGSSSVSSNSFVSLSLANQVAVGHNIVLTANATSISNPLYQFWFESPTSGWQSSGAYTSNNQFTIVATSPGAWHVVVYARPLKSPVNETASERAALEVPSPQSTVTVHN